jgi:hypothetical protein
MKAEIQAVASFLSAHLASPADQAKLAQLPSLLAARYASHWYPEDPERGSAFRSLQGGEDPALPAIDLGHKWYVGS